VRTNFFDEEDVAWQVSPLPEGKILAVGSAEKGRIGDLAFARYAADGSLDGSFGEGGKATVNVAGDAAGIGLLIAPDGGLILGANRTLKRLLNSRSFGSTRAVEWIPHLANAGPYRFPLNRAPRLSVCTSAPDTSSSREHSRTVTARSSHLPALHVSCINCKARNNYGRHIRAECAALLSADWEVFSK